MLGQDQSRFDVPDHFALERPQSTDSDAMTVTKQTLDGLRVEYDEKSPYHIKVGYVNFYPTRGTVNIDGQCRYKNRGLQFFLEVLRREGIIT